MSKVYNLHPDGSLNFVNLTAHIDLILQVFVVNVCPFLAHTVCKLDFDTKISDGVTFCVQCFTQIKPFYRNTFNNILTSWPSSWDYLWSVMLSFSRICWLFSTAVKVSFYRSTLHLMREESGHHQCTSTSVWKVHRRENSLQIV